PDGTETDDRKTKLLYICSGQTPQPQERTGRAVVAQVKRTEASLHREDACVPRRGSARVGVRNSRSPMRRRWREHYDRGGSSSAVKQPHDCQSANDFSEQTGSVPGEIKLTRHRSFHAYTVLVETCLDPVPPLDT